jgi:hypothetical protein
MKKLKTVLIAGAFALASTAAFAQAKVDMNPNASAASPNAAHNAGTDAGTKAPNATAGTTTGAGVSAPSAGAKIDSSTNAEINKNNPQGSRPGENTRKPGDMDKAR